MFLIDFAWAQSGGGESPLGLFLPLILIFVVFYFLLIRPQQRRQKEHRMKVEAIRRGDKVVTAGGIYGKVTSVRDNEVHVQVEIAKGVEVTVGRQMIADVIDPKAGPPAKPAGLLSSLFGGGGGSSASPTAGRADSDSGESRVRAGKKARGRPKGSKNRAKRD